MTDSPGPDTLRALVRQTRMTQAERDALLAHADAWQAERSDRTALIEQLAAVQSKLDAWERDRKWWQENTIKRRKRAEARRTSR
jgi:hypothetical protein